MSTRFVKVFIIVSLFAAFALFTQSSWAQTTTPAPTMFNRPDYNYAESDSCTRCHFSRGAGGDHMNEAVGIMYDDAKKEFKFTGGGWRASAHAVANYSSTQNTFCAKCHSPIQAKPEAKFKKGLFRFTEQIADGKVEGVTCAVCHPSHTSAVVLGRRLGVYKWGMDKSKPEAYDVVHHGQEDELCLNCHIDRHDEDNPAMFSMYAAGVKCMDCHMAVYGHVVNSEVEKRFHDFKVAKNLPYSCGVRGSMIECHPGFSKEGTMQFIPYLKQQHLNWWPLKPNQSLTEAGDYMMLWQEIEARVAK